MALTAAQKIDIRKYLGFPSLLKQGNPRLESALQSIDADSDLETEVTAQLSALANIETKLINALDLAGIKSVGTGDPEFYQGAVIKELRSEGRRLCSQLSMTIGVPLVGDPFSTAGYEGDSWMGRGFQYGFFW